MRPMSTLDRLAWNPAVAAAILAFWIVRIAVWGGTPLRWIGLVLAAVCFAVIAYDRATGDRLRRAAFPLDGSRDG
jgi:hypothetical protein